MIRSILFPMELDHALLDFFSFTATGAGTVLVIIFFAGLSIRRRTPFALRHRR